MPTWWLLLSRRPVVADGKQYIVRCHQAHVRFTTDLRSLCPTCAGPAISAYQYWEPSGQSITVNVVAQGGLS